MLPLGTVTFLFTDIEGSTRRWEVHGDVMASCISRRDSILRAAIERSLGIVVKNIGDGVMAVFASAHDALDAALTGQAGFEGEDWSPVSSLRVRMGLHTRWCEPTGGDYFGGVVNRAARIADAGNGGQILLSGASAVVIGRLGGGELVSRGAVQLKDLTEPIELFQVVAPGVDVELLTLRTVDTGVDDFPVQRTTFVGRSDELEHAARAAENERLVMLVGPGGVGKTRLAILDQLLRRSHGSVRRDAVEDPLDEVIRTLEGSEALLIVDNCEHVADEASRVVDAVLDHCHQVRVLATSREPLRIPGEQVISVAPFRVPTGEEDLEGSAAVRLFVECSVTGGAMAPSAD